MSSKERERQLARQRYERRQQRRELHRQRARQTSIVGATVVAVLAVIAAVAVLFATGHHGKKTAASASTPSPTASAAPSASSPAASASAGATNAAGTCIYTKSGQAARDVGIPPAQPVKQVMGARITLNRGVLAATLDGTKAPCTVNSFVFLAQKGYFSGVTCHRLTTQGIFVLQCGDPTGTGSGGPGYTFPDENLSSLGVQPGQSATYPAGTIAMANAGPNTNGSQFFLVYKDSPLPASYTPFGRITKGLDVLKRIAAAGSDNSNGPGDGHPKQKTVIDAIDVLR